MERRTILLVDDYPANLLALEAALEPLDQRLVKASSGAEALKFLLADRCSLIVLDVNMPGQDGFETAALIRSRPRTRDIPILFVTASAGPGRAREASEHGAADYIVRPIDAEVLRTKVRALLEMRERAGELERRYRSLVEATGQIVWSAHASGDVVEDSPSWRAFTGQTPEQSRGEGRLQAVHPDDRERTSRAWREALAEQRPYEAEFRLRRADGSYADVLSRAVPVRDDGGRVVEWLGTSIDLTEHKRSDLEVRASRDQLDVILGTVSEGITALDAAGRLVFANDEAARITGFSSGAEMLGETGTSMVERFELRDEGGATLPPERLPGRTALRTGLPASALLRLRRVGAEEARWVFVRSTPVAGPDSRPSLVINVMQDLTEQRRSAFAAQILAEAGRVLGSSLEADATLTSIAQLAVPLLADWCAVHVRDPGGSVRLLAVAGAAERHPLEPTTVPGAAAVLRSGKTEWAASAAKAQAPSVLSYIAVPFSARGEVLGSLTLVTTERSGRSYDAGDVRIAEELAERVGSALDNASLYRRAQEAVRVRDDFLSIASHELRTPLTPLRLQIQILRRLLEQGEPPPRERLAHSLETLERQTERLSRLVNDLLDVSRITAGKVTLQREKVDLAEVAREVVDRYAASSASRIVVEAQSAVGSWDRARLEQVATNLLVNAIKYGEGKPIDVMVQRRDGAALLLVRDRGIGIAPGDARRIFERFERAASASAYGGLGLGLYIAQQIAAAHGGRISVQSAPGEGATFQVELPVGDR